MRELERNYFDILFLVKYLEKYSLTEMELTLRDKQGGFRSGRGTVEQIFILRNIIEQVVEWQATLYITSVDFDKASDSVHRERERVYGKSWRAME